MQPYCCSLQSVFKRVIFQVEILFQFFLRIIYPNVKQLELHVICYVKTATYLYNEQLFLAITLTS